MTENRRREKLGRRHWRAAANVDSIQYTAHTTDEAPWKAVSDPTFFLGDPLDDHRLGAANLLVCLPAHFRFPRHRRPASLSVASPSLLLLLPLLISVCQRWLAGRVDGRVACLGISFRKVALATWNGHLGILYPRRRTPGKSNRTAGH